MNHDFLPADHPLNALRLGALALVGGLGLLTTLVALIPFARRQGTRRLWAVALGLLGIVAVDFALGLVRAQMDSVYSSVTLKTYTDPRFGPTARTWALVGMIAAPILYAVAVFSVRGNPKREREEELDFLLKEGLRHYFHRDYPAALMEFTAAVKVAPERAEPYCKRGCVFEQMGEHDMALADLDRALARDPRLAEAFLHRAIVLTARGEYDRALADFDQAGVLRPTDAEYHLQRGVCLARKGEAAEAVTEFEKVLRKTNYPEYAEPALKYLRELGGHVATSPKAEPLGPLS